MITGKFGLVQLITSNYVFDELITLVRRNLSHKKAVEVGERINASKVLRIDRVSLETEVKAWNIFKTHSDKEFSYTDCTS